MAEQKGTGDSGSALDRYLKRDEGAAGSMAASPASAFPPSTTKVDLNISGSAETTYEPGGFWRRFCAAVIDGIILSILSFVVKLPVNLIVLALFHKPDDIKAMTLIGTALSIAFGIAVWVASLYFYFGYFYRTRGATPGKLLLDLKVLNGKTGTYLTTGQTMGRELFGKLLSAFTLGIGYIMAGVRSDKKALHDIVCDTRVVHVKSKL